MCRPLGGRFAMGEWRRGGAPGSRAGCVASWPVAGQLVGGRLAASGRFGGRWHLCCPLNGRIGRRSVGSDGRAGVSWWGDQLAVGWPNRMAWRFRRWRLCWPLTGRLGRVGGLSWPSISRLGDGRRELAVGWSGGLLVAWSRVRLVGPG